MEIKNIGLFFIGLVILIVGTFIVIFDYPQIQFFENLESELYFLLDEEKKDIHQRLKIEFSTGVVFVFGGTALLLLSLIWKIKRK